MAVTHSKKITRIDTIHKREVSQLIVAKLTAAELHKVDTLRTSRETVFTKRQTTGTIDSQKTNGLAFQMCFSSSAVSSQFQSV